MSSILDTYDAAAAYKVAAMTSEPPDLDWVIRGWRGLRTYFMRAAAATERGNLGIKLNSLDKASKLLSLMQGITPPDENSIMAVKLRGLYTSFHLRLSAANAENDAATMRDLANQFVELDRIFSDRIANSNEIGRRT